MKKFNVDAMDSTIEFVSGENGIHLVEIEKPATVSDGKGKKTFLMKCDEEYFFGQVENGVSSLSQIKPAEYDFYRSLVEGMYNLTDSNFKISQENLRFSCQVKNIKIEDEAKLGKIIESQIEDILMARDYYQKLADKYGYVLKDVELVKGDMSQLRAYYAALKNLPEVVSRLSKEDYVTIVGGIIYGNDFVRKQNLMRLGINPVADFDLQNLFSYLLVRDGLKKN